MSVLMENLAEVIDGSARPLCGADDAVAALATAEALMAQAPLLV